MGIHSSTHLSQLLRINYVPGCVLGTQAIVMTRLLLPALRVMVSLKWMACTHHRNSTTMGRETTFPWSPLVLGSRRHRVLAQFCQSKNTGGLKRLSVQKSRTHQPLCSPACWAPGYTQSIFVWMRENYNDSFLGSSSFIYSGSILWLILSPESRPELSVGPQHILAFLTCIVSVGPHLVDLGTWHL